MTVIEYENPPLSSQIATPVSAANPLPVTGNLSATVGNISLGNSTANIGAVTVTSGNVTTPAEGVTGAAVPADAIYIGFGNATGCLAGVSATNPLPITGNLSSSPTANQTVVVTSGNVTVNGSLTSAGNVTAIVGALPAGAAIIGALVANQTVQVTNTPAVTVASGNVTVNGSLTSGGNVTATGAAANNASPSGNPITIAALASSTEPTAATTGQNASLFTGLEHKLIVLPHANKENMLRGNVTVANTTAGNVTGMAAQGAGQKIYITGAQALRTDAGATLAYVTLNDSNSSNIPLPPLSGSVIRYDVPLVVAANTTVTVTLNANITSALINLQGYFGT
jgi:hypothetical protein